MLLLEGVGFSVADFRTCLESLSSSSACNAKPNAARLLAS